MIKTIQEQMAQIDNIDHNNASESIVFSVIDLISSQCTSSTVRISAQYKITLMLSCMPSDNRERAMTFLLETLCSTTDSWLQRNILELIRLTTGSELNETLGKILSQDNIHSLVRVRAAAIGIPMTSC